MGAPHLTPSLLGRPLPHSAPPNPLCPPLNQVRFQDINVSADVQVGQRATPTLLNSLRNVVDAALLRRANAQPFPILTDISGVLCPRRLTLLLGPAASGKSTLLHALAGRLHSTRRVPFSGDITYNGHGFGDFVPERAAALVQQRDVHAGELTVRETLDFAARCQGCHTRQAELERLRQAEAQRGLGGEYDDPELDALMHAMAVEGQEHSVSTELMLRLLRLTKAADTVVGSPLLRGISGGEKKRLTLGEITVGGGRKVLFADEISTGLDSSTTFGIVNSLASWCHILEATVLISLLAPPPETFDLFDDVLVLADGRLVYFGPRDQVVPFFTSLGFVKPPRAAAADFIQQCLSPVDQRGVWGGGRSGSEPYSPVSITSMVAAFHSSPFSAAQEAKLAERGAACALPEDDNMAGGGLDPGALLPRRPYALPWWGMARANAWRDILFLRRNSFVYIFRTMQTLVGAVLAGTLFLRTRLHVNQPDGTLYLGFLFFTLASAFFTNFSEMALSVAHAPVADKHMLLRFHDASSYAIPTALLRFPISVAESCVWTPVSYWLVGLTPSAGRFLHSFAIFIVLHFTAGCVFRAVGAVGRTLLVASTIGSLTALVLFTLSGFTLARNDVPGWWIGGVWATPLWYALNSLATNEFTAHRWQRLPDPSGKHASLGDAVLKSRDLETSRLWAWIAYPILLGFSCIFTLVGILALRLLRPPAPGRTVTEKELQQRRLGSVGVEKVEANPHAGAVAESAAQGRGASMPFLAASLTFQDICYYVPTPGNRELQLLRNITGSFVPGRLTALIGSTGAGKTTLMDVLAGRKTVGRITGDIRVNGFPKEQRTFTRIASYCEQTDVHAPQTTVLEAVQFSAAMRLPDDVAPEQRAAFVEDVLIRVEMDAHRHALVGVPGVTGLSAEQRKRLTIAVELVANPSIVFLDEPTSGLDSRSAAVVVRAVRAGVDIGRTVVCTIHQPSVQVFEAFHELLVLRPGGECVFFGPLGDESKDMISYFTGLSHDIQPPAPAFNPATWVLDITSTSSEEALGLDFAEEYGRSAAAEAMAGRTQQLAQPQPGAAPVSFASDYARSTRAQLALLLRRNWRTWWRSPSYNLVRLMMTVLIALFFGTVYWARGDKRSTLSDVFNIMGAMYAAVLFLGVNNASTVQPVVAAERDVSYRERGAGMYAALPWAAAIQVVEVPYLMAQTSVYVGILYPLVHFQWTAAKFWWFWLFQFETLVTFTFYGQLAVAVTPNVELASIISSFFYSWFNLTAGFLMPVPRQPWWWRWYAYVGNPVQWALYGLVGSQLGDVNDGCLRGLPPPRGGGPAPCMTTAQFMRSHFGFHHHRLGLPVGALAAFAVAFTAVATLAHTFLNFQRR